MVQGLPIYKEMSLIYDVIIVGGGPAGLTAGLYASRARLKTLLIEKLTMGGQAIITDVIENYPGFPEGVPGAELGGRIKKQAEKFGLEFALDEVKKVGQQKEEDFSGFELVVGDKIYRSMSIILAVGASPRKLGVPGEAEFTGRGVSYCATCDGAFFKDKEIMVVGGGDTAVEEALFLTRFGRKVTLVHRRDRLRATKILQERILRNPKADFLWNSQVIEISGGKVVQGVKVKDVKTQEVREVSTDGVFIFAGLVPNTKFVGGLVKLDEKGYIVTDNEMRTSQGGIFAAGDCRSKALRQVVTACGDGATAAFSVQHYVEKLKGTAYE